MFACRYLAVCVSLFFTGLLTMLASLARSTTTILLTLGPPEFFGAALGMCKQHHFLSIT